MVQASGLLLPGVWLQGSGKISKSPRIGAATKGSSPALNKPRQAQAEPASRSFLLREPPGPGAGDASLWPQIHGVVSLQTDGADPLLHVRRKRAAGQKTRVPRRGALPGHQARSAVEPIPPRHRVPAPPPLPLAGIGASSATVRTPGRPSSPPGARSRSRRPDSTAIATLPGASCFSAAGPKPRQAEGACKKANETMGPARRNAQHAGLNPRKRQGETASRARMREVSRVWTCRVQDIASPESWEDLTVPIRGDGEGLLVPESGTRLGPPPAGAPPPLTEPPSSGAACSRGASARASRGAEAGGGHRQEPPKSLDLGG